MQGKRETPNGRRVSSRREGQAPDGRKETIPHHYARRCYGCTKKPLLLYFMGRKCAIVASSFIWKRQKIAPHKYALLPDYSRFSSCVVEGFCVGGENIIGMCVRRGVPCLLQPAVEQRHLSEDLNMMIIKCKWHLIIQRFYPVVCFVCLR